MLQWERKVREVLLFESWLYAALSFNCKDVYGNSLDIQEII